MKQSLGSTVLNLLLIGLTCVIQCSQSKPMSDDGNLQDEDLSSALKSKQIERDEFIPSSKGAALDSPSPLENLHHSLPTSGNMFSSLGSKETEHNSKESWSDVVMPRITLDKNENLGQSSQAANQDTAEKSISDVNQKLLSLTDAVPQMKSFYKETDEELESRPTGQLQLQNSQLLPTQFGHLDQNYLDQEQGQQSQNSPEQRGQFGQVQLSQYDLGKYNPLGQKQQSQNIIDQQNYLDQTQQLQRSQELQNQGQKTQYSLSPQNQLARGQPSQDGMGQQLQQGFGQQEPYEQGQQIQHSIGQQTYSDQAQQSQYDLEQQNFFGQKQQSQYSVDQLNQLGQSQHSLEQQNQFGQEQQSQDGFRQQSLLDHVQQSQYDSEQQNQFIQKQKSSSTERPKLPDSDLEQPVVREKDGQYQYNTGKPRSTEIVEVQMSKDQDMSNSKETFHNQMKSYLQTSTLEPSYLDSKLEEAYEEDEEEEEKEMEEDEEEDEMELDAEERDLYKEDKDTEDKSSLYEGSYKGKLYENSESEYYSDPKESTHVTADGLVNDEQDKENESDDWYDDPNSYDEDGKYYGNKNSEDDADEGDNREDVAKTDDYFKTDGEYQGDGDVFEEDVVDSDMVKKDKQPTAPSSMVLFYTWMIVVILIMVVSVSTYQTRCKGIRSQIPKLTHTEDRKRLLDHEYA